MSQCKDCKRQADRERRRKKQAGWTMTKPYEMDYEPATELAPIHPDEAEVMRGAACRGLPSLFLVHPDAARCSQVCAACPVFDKCRTVVDHIEKDATFRQWSGYWAGETVTERAQRRGVRITDGGRFYQDKAA